MAFTKQELLDKVQSYFKSNSRLRVDVFRRFFNELIDSVYNQPGSSQVSYEELKTDIFGTTTDVNLQEILGEPSIIQFLSKGIKAKYIELQQGITLMNYVSDSGTIPTTDTYFTLALNEILFIKQKVKSSGTSYDMYETYIFKKGGGSYGLLKPGSTNTIVQPCYLNDFKLVSKELIGQRQINNMLTGSDLDRGLQLWSRQQTDYAVNSILLWLENLQLNKANLVDGKIPSTELPSYVDDVIEVNDFASLPTHGESSKIYITLDNNKSYRWGGTAYVELVSLPDLTNLDYWKLGGNDTDESLGTLTNKDMKLIRNATLYIALLAGSVIQMNGQVGINTNTPKVTLDIVGKPDDTSVKDGLLIPRLRLAQLSGKTYSSEHTGTLIYVTELLSMDEIPPSYSPPFQIEEIDSIGFYYFNGTKWATIKGKLDNIELTRTESGDSTYKTVLSTSNSAFAATKTSINAPHQTYYTEIGYNQQALVFGYKEDSKPNMLYNVLQPNYSQNTSLYYILPNTSGVLATLNDFKVYDVSGASPNFTLTLKGVKNIADLTDKIFYIRFGATAPSALTNVFLNVNDLGNFRITSGNNTSLTVAPAPNTTLGLVFNGIVFQVVSMNCEMYVTKHLSETISGAKVFTNQMSIGTSLSPNSTLQIGGSLSTPYRGITTPTEVTNMDYTIHIRGTNSFVQPLITAVGKVGRVLEFVNESTGAITLQGDSGELIGTSNTFVLSSGGAVVIKSTGSKWIITAKY